MRTIFAVFLCSLAGCVSIAEETYETYEYQLENGFWYGNGIFEGRTAWVRDGRLHFDGEGRKATEIIDLKGGYVVPPYCEGHNHNIGGHADLEAVEQTSRAYLKDGVFYAMMPGSFAQYRTQIADKINHPNSIDVAFANNGLTGPGGHPRGLRERLMERFGLYPEFTPETLPDNGYFEAADSGQLREKWRLITGEKPDLVKVMLYFSEEYDKRKDNEEYYGKRGLNPALLPELVRLAHTEGLRVAVHVKSEADMIAAIKADADIIAHLPSYDASLRLSDETIELARSSRIALVTTFSLAKRIEQRDPNKHAAILEAQKDNLARLEKAGAWLVVGSDNTRDTSRAEVDHLSSLNVLANADLLRMWTSDCAKLVFPDRKIGRLEHGYEASFLVLEDNPLDDFANTAKIVLRIKDGEVIRTLRLSAKILRHRNGGSLKARSLRLCRRGPSSRRRRHAAMPICICAAIASS